MQTANTSVPSLSQTYSTFVLREPAPINMPVIQLAEMSEDGSRAVAAVTLAGDVQTCTGGLGHRERMMRIWWKATEERVARETRFWARH